MRRTILLAGALPFVSAFLGGVLALSLVGPQTVTAQASQPQEVRASAFTLVAPDGTVLASLQRSGAGNANLGLNDGTGTRRMSLGGSGNLNVYDQDGTDLVFRAGRTYEGGTTNNPELNGVQLGPDGSIGTLP